MVSDDEASKYDRERQMCNVRDEPLGDSIRYNACKDSLASNYIIPCPTIVIVISIIAKLMPLFCIQQLANFH